MKRFLYVTILCGVSFLFAGNTSIVRVLDGNLFELNTGQKIRLANVRTPSLKSKDANMAALAKVVVRFAQMQLTDQTVKIDFSEFRDDSGFVLAHVYQIYPLEKRNMKAVFLEKGFGWFVNNADSLHIAEYRKAEETAQKKHRGVWNPNYPVPAPEQEYQVALFLGGLKEKQDEYTNESSYYQEAMVEASPVEKESGIIGRIGIIRHVEDGSGCCDCALPPEAEPQAYHHVSLMMYAGARLQMMTDFMGFTIGMTAAYNDRNYCSEGYKYFILPNAGLKVGWMKKFYVTADLFSEYILPFSVGLQYIFDRKATNLWVGMMHLNDKDNFYAFKGNYMLNKQWILKAQGILSYPELAPGFRIGVGHVISGK